MANHYRIIFNVWSANPEPVHSFLGALIVGGWYTHFAVPDSIPTLDSHGDRTIGPEIRAWGGYLFPDMRILTTHGLIDVCEPGHNLPQFAATSIAKRISQSPADGEHPGFIGPKSSDHMASIIAESRAGIPWRFFQEADSGSSFSYTAMLTPLTVGQTDISSIRYQMSSPATTDRSMGGAFTVSRSHCAIT